MRMHTGLIVVSFHRLFLAGLLPSRAESAHNGGTGFRARASAQGSEAIDHSEGEWQKSSATEQMSNAIQFGKPAPHACLRFAEAEASVPDTLFLASCKLEIIPIPKASRVSVDVLR
jgi:hypothetical protein